MTSYPSILKRSTNRAPLPVLARAMARAPGTCGELAQGLLGGSHFHVTCPIDLYATARVELVPGTGRVFGARDSPKASRGAELVLASTGLRDMDAHVLLDSPLPRGKGMASSTADVAATVAATAAALEIRMPPEEIGRIAIQVEPSDGLMFPGVVLFDHRRGSLFEELGPPPPMRVLVLDFGGTVDTVAFNDVDRAPLLAWLEPQWRESVDLVRRGLASGDANLVGAGATLNTVAYGQVTPWPHLNEVLALAKDTCAVGVNAAHSGTVMGLLYPEDEALVRRAERTVRSRLPGLEAVYRQRLTGGGVEIELEAHSEARERHARTPPKRA